MDSIIRENWVIISAVASGLLGYGSLRSQVQTNTEDIKVNSSEIKDMKTLSDKRTEEITKIVGSTKRIEDKFDIFMKFHERELTRLAAVSTTLATDIDNLRSRIK